MNLARRPRKSAPGKKVDVDMGHSLASAYAVIYHCPITLLIKSFVACNLYRCPKPVFQKFLVILSDISDFRNVIFRYNYT